MLKKLPKFTKNFYFICSFSFLIWMVFLDSNDLIDQVKLTAKLWNLEKQKIDLLLTDMVLPEETNGRELALRLLDEKPSLKILVFSGYMPNDAGKDLEAYGIEFLAKPAPVDRLLQEGGVVRAAERHQDHVRAALLEQLGHAPPDGAHALHEHVEIAALPFRAALIAGLIGRLTTKGPEGNT